LLVVQIAIAALEYKAGGHASCVKLQVEFDHPSVVEAKQPIDLLMTHLASTHGPRAVIAAILLARRLDGQIDFTLWITSDVRVYPRSDLD